MIILESIIYHYERDLFKKNESEAITKREMRNLKKEIKKLLFRN